MYRVSYHVSCGCNMTHCSTFKGQYILSDYHKRWNLQSFRLQIQVLQSVKTTTYRLVQLFQTYYLDQEMDAN